MNIRVKVVGFVSTCGHSRNYLLPLLLTLPAVAQAQFFYVTNGGTITITRYTGSGGDVTIPDTINGLPVTGIGFAAFDNCTKLTNVTIPNSVTTIGGHTFYRCTSLTSVTIPSSVTNIGEMAFGFCTSLISVTIGNSVTDIGEAAFYYCFSLRSITIPDSVTTIGLHTFMFCSNLTRVTIPNSVTSIGGGAFSNCTSLTNLMIGNGVTSIGWDAFALCTSLTNAMIGNSVTSIEVGAFNCTKLTSVTIPSSVTNIGYFAFGFCSSLGAITVDAKNPAYSSVDGVLFNKSQTTLMQYPTGNAATSYTIPSSVTSIGDSAFRFCSNLTTVTIPNSVAGIGDSAFEGCSSLTNAMIGNSVTDIGYAAFNDCTKLTSVTIPNSVTYIGMFAFLGCTSLGAITVDANNPAYSSVDGVLFNKSQTTLMQYPIGNAAISYAIPSSVTSIGESAFRYCSNLTSVTIPNSVASIGKYAFGYCSRLASVTIPNRVASIGDSAFEGCSSLTSVTIPNSVTYVGMFAFLGCTSLGAITVDVNNPAYSSVDGVLCNKGQTILMQYPIGNAATSYAIPSSVTWIWYSAFRYCSNLTNVTIPNSVAHIVEYAFAGCTNLIGVYFNGNAPSLSSSVFSDDNNATVYCLPGATGWGSTFGGLPTALWDPQPQGVGVRSNEFGFTITGTTNIPIVVEASANLASASWTALQSCTITNGSIHFSDPQWTNYPARFYRLRSP